MKCPVDGAELFESRYEGSVMVDNCPTCAGMWLDRGELEAILETHERDHGDELEHPEDSVGAVVEVARQRTQPVENCPKCAAVMERREYGYSSGVLIDACTKGCGIWLDKAELGALEVFYERLRAEDTNGSTSKKSIWQRFFALLGDD